MTATTEESDRGRRLTGRGVLLWLFAFFGVTFAVNGAFIYFAVSTFPGVEVASSYKAGQEFEGEIAAGRAQAERFLGTALFVPGCVNDNQYHL